MRKAAKAIAPALMLLATSALAQGEIATGEATVPVPDSLSGPAQEAQRQLRQTFTNLQFEDFGLAPVKGPLYQASAGGRIIYYAPQSEHLLFAAVYDRSGVNVTALAQDALARKRLGQIDESKALVISPAGAPKVIEFTDPDCPYCRALERFWNSKAAEGKPVRRFIYFVSGIHPQAASKAQHIYCSPDREAAFKSIYAGEAPKKLLTCPQGVAKIASDAETVTRMGVSGTPTLFLDGKLVSGFSQAEIQAFLDEKATKKSATR